MIEKFFGAVTRFGKKHKFQNNIILKSLIPVYHWIQRLVTSDVNAASGENTLGSALTNDFLAKNPERIEAVAKLLADEKSKATYLAMVKFRQTGKKRDFPLKLYEKVQYFIKELPLGDGEVFVDCGAFTGDTVDQFIKRCPGYGRIVAFEPDPESFGKLKKKHGGNEKITLINAGAYEKEGEITFDAQGNGYSKFVGSAVSGNIDNAVVGADGNRPVSGNIDNVVGNRPIPTSGITTIHVQSIDNLQLEKVSFIKMDVEGAEMDALRGARKTIVRDKPKLAICIYHSNEDMVRVAEYIHELVPEYKLYVRQHFLFPSAAETVVYAVM
jgi:FkbM family methyltransferase